MQYYRSSQVLSPGRYPVASKDSGLQDKTQGQIRLCRKWDFFCKSSNLRNQRETGWCQGSCRKSSLSSVFMDAWLLAAPLCTFFLPTGKNRSSIFFLIPNVNNNDGNKKTLISWPTGPMVVNDSDWLSYFYSE